MSLNLSCPPELASTGRPPTVSGTITYGILIFLILTGLIGNLFGIVVTVFVKRLHTFPNYLSLNLAISDIVTAVFVNSLMLHNMITETHVFENSLACDIIGFISSITPITSLLILFTMAAQRYITCNRTSFAKKLSKSRLKLAFDLSMPWILATIFDVVLNKVINTGHIWDTNVYLCLYVHTDWRVSTVHYAFLVLCTAMLFSSHYYASSATYKWPSMNAASYAAYTLARSVSTTTTATTASLQAAAPVVTRPLRGAMSASDVQEQARNSNQSSASNTRQSRFRKRARPPKLQVNTHQKTQTAQKPDDQTSQQARNKRNSFYISVAGRTLNLKSYKAEKVQSTLRRSTLLVLAFIMTCFPWYTLALINSIWPLGKSVPPLVWLAFAILEHANCSLHFFIHSACNHRYRNFVAKNLPPTLKRALGGSSTYLPGQASPSSIHHMTPPQLTPTPLDEVAKHRGFFDVDEGDENEPSTHKNDQKEWDAESQGIVVTVEADGQETDNTDNEQNNPISTLLSSPVKFVD